MLSVLLLANGWVRLPTPSPNPSSKAVDRTTGSPTFQGRVLAEYGSSRTRAHPRTLDINSLSREGRRGGSPCRRSRPGGPRGIHLRWPIRTTSSCERLRRFGKRHWRSATRLWRIGRRESWRREHARINNAIEHLHRDRERAGSRRMCHNGDEVTRPLAGPGKRSRSLQHRR